jgi:hypothetical protein
MRTNKKISFAILGLILISVFAAKTNNSISVNGLLDQNIEAMAQEDGIHIGYRTQIIIKDGVEGKCCGPTNENTACDDSLKFCPGASHGL